MPSGTFAVDTATTFSSAFLMASQPKTEFGTQAQQFSADGTPKWTCQIAVTFAAQNDKMAPVSEVLNVSVTAARDPGLDIQPGTPVTFEGLMVGVSAPEKRDNGRVVGGKFWYSATGLHSVAAYRGKSEAAA